MCPGFTRPGTESNRCARVQVRNRTFGSPGSCGGSEHPRALRLRAASGTSGALRCCRKQPKLMFRSARKRDYRAVRAVDIVAPLPGDTGPSPALLRARRSMLVSTEWIRQRARRRTMDASESKGTLRQCLDRWRLSRAAVSGATQLSVLTRCALAAVVSWRLASVLLRRRRRVSPDHASVGRPADQFCPRGDGRPGNRTARTVEWTSANSSRRSTPS